jgi:hypothetical protein
MDLCPLIKLADNAVSVVCDMYSSYLQLSSIWNLRMCHAVVTDPLKSYLNAQLDLYNFLLTSNNKW